jgi:peptidoglycan hydrolase-like protein with peptidoglycan-binding domain
MIMTGVVVGYDATRTAIPQLPPNAQVYAGYSTGIGFVPWTEADFAAHATALGPCLRIDQDPSASDPTADYLDVENGAATIADCPGWVQRAQSDFAAARRPGQRSPAIYMSASNVTAVVNELVNAGINSGVGLVVANWSITEGTAIQDVLGASGPFPIVAVQFADPGPYDINVYSTDWLASQSGLDWTEQMIMTLPTLQKGSQDKAGEIQYVHRVQALTAVIGQINNLAAASSLALDGNFDPATAAAVQAVQAFFNITSDGVVGPITWHHLVCGD